jgi:hypothetical protein
LSAKWDRSRGLSLVESIQQSLRSLCDKPLVITSMLSLITAFYEWTRLRPSRRRLPNISAHLLPLSMPPAFFLSRVKGTSDPETKHKVIGNTFIEVFQNKAKEIAAIAAGSPQAGDIELLLQGTLYLDTLRRGKISVTVYEGCGPL